MVDTTMEEHLLICEFKNDGAKADDVDDDDNGGTDDDDYEIISLSDEDDVVNDKEDDYGGLFESPEPVGEVVTCPQSGCKWQCFVMIDFANKDDVLAKHITDKHCCGGDGESAAPKPTKNVSSSPTWAFIVCRAKRCGWSRWISPAVIANDVLETHEKSCRRYVQEKMAARSYAAACSAQHREPSSRLPRLLLRRYVQDPPPPAAPEDGGPRKKTRQHPSSPEDALHELSVAALAASGRGRGRPRSATDQARARVGIFCSSCSSSTSGERQRLDKLLARAAAEKSLQEERKRRTNVSKEVIVLLL
jgi:hypothetical protein